MFSWLFVLLFDGELSESLVSSTRVLAVGSSPIHVAKMPTVWPETAHWILACFNRVRKSHRPSARL